MNHLYIIVAVMSLMLFSSCGTGRLASSQVADSTRVEVNTVTEYVHDTIFIEIPVISERIVTRDTSSFLENSYAKSEASITDGFLSHSLETKPVKVPVQVETKIVHKDSLIYRDKVQTQAVEIPCKLSRWQTFKMRIGSATIAFLFIAIVTAALYFFFHFKQLFKP